MQETKKKKKNGGASGNENSKKKERHIVTWTQQEDDILREQISLNGTQNWTIIASKFKDKTTRQCRRRWYTYLNSDFKKGGWSPEEDMLLCEAQKIFGNRWTEIAKVVSGRTDNAVKNRFSTLCKKRAKYEALAKENSNSYINTNNKRILLQNGTTDCAAPVKRMRYHNINDECQNALMQQAELLSALALKVNTDDTEQSLENAWKVLQDFLNQGKENDTRYTISDINFQIEDSKDLLEDLRSSNEGSQLSWRQPDLYEVSPSSSEYSTGSTLMPRPTGERGDTTRAETDALHSDILSSHVGEKICGTEEETRVLSCANTNHVEITASSADQTNITSTIAEFSSPVQVTPLFRSLAAGIPSPKFSESERNFLLKTLGMESPSPNPTNHLSQPPPCRRALLHSL